MKQDRHLLYLALIILVKSVFAIFVILYAEVGLSPDEAQYWTWSKALDFGYYSKPPAIAWQIHLGTLLFGDTELGIRSTAVVVSALIAFAVYYLALCCNLKSTTALYAGAIMALTPMGILSSFLATTDGGLVLFWTLSCATIAYTLSRQKPLSFALLGIFIAFGALYKWPIYLLWIAVAVLLWKAPFLRTWHLASNFIISLLGLLPSIIWNWTHEWSTFRHVFATVQGGSKPAGAANIGFAHGNFLEFIGAQATLLSPLLFILLLIAFALLIKERKQIALPVAFCGFLSLAILAVYSVGSIVQKIQGNWCVFAYPTAIVLLCWYFCERFATAKIWLIVGVAISLIITPLGLSIPYIQNNSLFSRMKLPCKINPFRHSLGWGKLPELLEKAGYNRESDFLFGDRYQTSSILSFYGPGQRRAYFLNIHGVRKNQFSYWPTMHSEQLNKNGFYVWIINGETSRKQIADTAQNIEKSLAPYFAKVTLAIVEPIFFCYDKPVKTALIFHAEAYNGQEPTVKAIY